MEQNGKPLDFIGNVELFSGTMEERFDNGRSAMVVVVSDGVNTYTDGFGGEVDLIDALSTAMCGDEDLLRIVQISLSLAITAKYNNQTKGNDDDTD